MSKLYEKILMGLIEKLPMLIPLIWPKLKKAYCEGGRAKIQAKIDPDNDEWYDEVVLGVLDIVFGCDG